jgi:hypothetical protein
MREITIQQLVVDHTDAYNALSPEYQADNCLRFWILEDKTLNWIVAAPAMNQVSVLGQWVSMYVNGLWNEPPYGHFLFKIVSSLE